MKATFKNYLLPLGNYLRPCFSAQRRRSKASTSAHSSTIRETKASSTEMNSGI